MLITTNVGAGLIWLLLFIIILTVVCTVKIKNKISPPPPPKKIDHEKEAWKKFKGY